jgi:biotin carboxylase
MQLPSIRIAKRKGWRVILADGKAGVPGAALADCFERVDLADREGMSRMAMRHRNDEGLDGVFTAGTDFSTTVAWVSERCGLPGISYEVALTATDKARMRRALRRHGVPGPDFWEISNGDDPVRALETVKLPLVVKPVDCMGARGVCRVDTLADLRKACKRALKFSRSSRVIVETYIPGPELSIDAIVYRGRVTLCGIADRHIRFPPFFVEMGHTMPTSHSARILKQVERVFRNGVAAIGIDNGAAKGDIKLGPDGVRIGEIAARLSGGYMSGWTYPFATGVEVTEAALNIAVGLPPGNLQQKRRHVSAERAFISIPGKVKEIAGVERARSQNDVEELFLRASPGDEVVFPKNNVEKCGNVISRAPDRNKAVRAAENSARSVFIRLEPANPATEEFLFGNGHGGSVPSAFRLSHPENLRFLAKMPRFKKADGSLAVWTLPFLSQESAKDWHGKGLQEAFAEVLELTNIPVVDRGDDSHYCLGSLFWHAFLRGGPQAGVYVIETVNKARCSGLNGPQGKALCGDSRSSGSLPRNPSL